jgi:hypothetical protein
MTIQLHPRHIHCFLDRDADNLKTPYKFLSTGVGCRNRTPHLEGVAGILEDLIGEVDQAVAGGLWTDQGSSICKPATTKHPNFRKMLGGVNSSLWHAPNDTRSSRKKQERKRLTFSHFRAASNLDMEKSTQMEATCGQCKECIHSAIVSIKHHLPTWVGEDHHMSEAEQFEHALI